MNITSLLHLGCKAFEIGITPYMALLKTVRFQLVQVYYGFGTIKFILTFIFT